MRSGSRSPRRGPEDASTEAIQPEIPDWTKAGIPPLEEGIPTQLRMQKAFLQQFLTPPLLLEKGPVRSELAAGLSLEAAEVFLTLSPSVQGGRPWTDLPAQHGCVAAALVLFGQLVPKQVAEDACEEYCHRVRQRTESGCRQIQTHAASTVVEAASDAGLEAVAVSDGTDSLQKMVRNEAAACVLFLDAYVGIAEDAMSGEETEHEVGEHCVLVLGGDLSGPSYCVFDPWGAKAGSLAYWSAHDVQQAGPLAWVELSPQLGKETVSRQGSKDVGN